jgi:hypothetical protein
MNRNARSSKNRNPAEHLGVNFDKSFSSSQILDALRDFPPRRTKVQSQRSEGDEANTFRQSARDGFKRRRRNNGVVSSINSRSRHR